MGAHDQGADATTGRWLVIPRTLCFVLHEGAVLLMRRAATRRVFPNRYNGLGGHIERDEDPAAGVRREVREESGLDVTHLRLRGVIHIDAGASTGMMLFVYTAWAVTRDVQGDGREGTLHWVPFADVLGLDLVEDLPQLWPRLLSMADDAPLISARVSYGAADAFQILFDTDAPDAEANA